MLDTLLVFGNTILTGFMFLALILGFTLVIMGFISTKTGAEAMKERIEYGFLGVSGLVVSGLLAYAL